MKKNLNIKISKNLKLSKRKENALFLKKIIDNSSQLPLRLKISILLNPTFNLKLFFSSISFNKFKRQCLLTWRSRSIYSFFDMSRVVIRELSSFGFLKGIKKSSW